MQQPEKKRIKRGCTWSSTLFSRIQTVEQERIIDLLFFIYGPGDMTSHVFPLLFCYFTVFLPVKGGLWIPCTVQSIKARRAVRGVSATTHWTAEELQRQDSWCKSSHLITHSESPARSSALSLVNVHTSVILLELLKTCWYNRIVDWPAIDTTIGSISGVL